LGGDSDFAKKLDGIPDKERASMGGPVAAGTTYESWFAEQDRERQLEILGPGRMGMYERGTLGFSDMVNMAGKPMTLGELQEKQEKVADKPEHELFFEKAVKEVLEKIECPVPIVMGDLEAIAKEVLGPRARVKGLNDNLGLYVARGNTTKRIAINKNFVQEWIEKGTALRDYDRYDGYYVYDQLTPKQQLTHVIVHEIAHALDKGSMTPQGRPTAESKRTEGHTQNHEDLMYKLLSLLYPNISSLPRQRVAWFRK